MKNNIPKPFTKIKVNGLEGKIQITTLNRVYTFDNSLLFTSIKSSEKELLNSPIEVKLNEPEGDFIFNSAHIFVDKMNDEEVTICGTQESNKFIINTMIKISYDGLAKIDLKVVPRGRTVNQVFGVEKDLSKDYSLNKLQVLIHINKEVTKYYHFWPIFYKSQMPIYEKNDIEFSKVCMSRMFNQSMSMEFKPILYLYNDEVGLSFQADSDENWNSDEKKAIEVLKKEDETLLILNLLSHHPNIWNRHKENPNFLENYGYMPLSFKFSLEATPLKIKNNTIYNEKSLHIDCFKKIKEDYYEFLLKNTHEGFKCNLDYIKSKGVTILYLHEKWNEIQNDPIVSIKRGIEIKEIIKECHKRKIKVVPYFGYEISTLSPFFSEKGMDVTQYVGGEYPNFGGWYRQSPQRCYIECLSTEFKDYMLNGFKKLFNDFKFDGIYLDSTVYPDPCCNTKHGCGYIDINNKLHNTYPITPIYEYIKEVYKIVKKHNGIVELHSSNCINVSSFAFADVIWDGEAIQTYLHENSIDAIPIDYLFAEHPLRALGLDYEYLIYTFDNWSFKDGLSLSLPLGMLPKPNDIDIPLSIMEGIWKIYDKFNVKSREYISMFENKEIEIDGSVIYCLYKKNPTDYLFIVSNPRSKDTKININPRYNAKYTELFSNEEIKKEVILKGSETKIIHIEEEK